MSRQASRRFPVVLSMLLLAALALAEPAGAETIELLNGDLVRGKVLSLDSQVLKVQSESFGALSIKRDKVAAIYLSERKVDLKPPKASDLSRSDLDQIPSAGDVLKRLQANGGVSAEDMKAVQRQLPLLATPEVQGFVGERLRGLLSGELKLADIREEAIDAVDQINDLQKDLGPQANALNGYLSILESFIRETAPKDGDHGVPAETRETPAK